MVGGHKIQPYVLPASSYVSAYTPLEGNSPYSPKGDAKNGHIGFSEKVEHTGDTGRGGGGVGRRACRQYPL